MHLKYKSNEYADLVESIYDKIPKTVFAAIAVSLIIKLEGEETIDQETITRYLIDEWKVLYQNKILPQRPKTTKDEPVLGAQQSSRLGNQKAKRGMENKKADTGSPSDSSERGS